MRVLVKDASIQQDTIIAQFFIYYLVCLVLSFALCFCIDWFAKSWLKQHRCRPYLVWSEFLRLNFLFHSITIFLISNFADLIIKKFFGLGVPSFKFITLSIPLIPTAFVRRTPFIEPYAESFSSASQKFFVPNIHLTFRFNTYLSKGYRCSLTLCRSRSRRSFSIFDYLELALNNIRWRGAAIMEGHRFFIKMAI